MTFFDKIFLVSPITEMRNASLIQNIMIKHINNNQENNNAFARGSHERIFE